MILRWVFYQVDQRELTTLSVDEVCELLHLLGCPVPISLLRDEVHATLFALYRGFYYYI